MDEHRRTEVEDWLEAVLVDASPAFPPTPDLSSRIAGAVAAGTSLPSVPRGRRVRMAALLAAILIVAAAGMAVAGAFGVGPLRIVFTSSVLPSTLPDTPIGARLALGREVPVEQLSEATDLPLLRPAGLRHPDEAYLSELGILSLVWAADDELPRAGGSGIGLLVMVIPGDLDGDLLSKVVIEADARLEGVAIGSRSGFWISGPPHVLRYVLPNGDQGQARTRLVGDVLLWQEDDAVYRIESALGKDATIALAESLVAIE